MFEKPCSAASEKEEKELYLCSEHRSIARKAAEKSAVLLKNENILPFDKNTIKKIAVIGPFADKVMLGAWSCYGQESEGVSVLQGVKNLLPDIQVLFAKGCLDGVKETDCSMIPFAVEKAKESDAVVVCVGERSDMSGESMSRAQLRLSVAQKTLIRELVKANPNTAVVLFNGRPLVLTDVIEDISALMTAWQPGTEGGNAIANLLFGEVNFSGKLPMTFPRSEGQIPIYYNSYRTGRPYCREYGSWYLDMPNTPLFPFGYGLSYTEFKLSQPQISKTAMEREEVLEIYVDVENTGKREGETVLQLYICDEHASLVRPVKELKGYQKIKLSSSEKKRISFTLTEDLLKFWSANDRFEAERGWFTVWISDSSNVGKGVRFYLK